MGALEVSHLNWSLPAGQVLFDDVSFRVGNGEHIALVGANGTGKTTIMRLISGAETGYTGTIGIDGSLGVMTQLVGALADSTTVRDLYLSLSDTPLQTAATRLAKAEAVLAADASDRNGMAFATALEQWGTAGGYDAEVFWDTCATKALGLTWPEIGERPASTFSGGEQKRLALEFLLRSHHDILLLDEPDNFLDVPGKEWLADELNATPKTVLYVSHDRELLATTSHKVVTLEGRGAWTHGGSFATWHEAREQRQAQIDDEQKRWAEERKRLLAHMREQKRRAAMSDANARRAKAAETRLRHFDEGEKPREMAKDQNISMRLGGGRTGKEVVVCKQLELVDITFPFDTTIWFGERVAVLGLNGTGKSHFLRLLAGDESVQAEGAWKLGARVVPGWFSQTHDHPELVNRTLLEILADHDLARGPATRRLRRYELDASANQTWETLSGGQQARFQVLLLELTGATLLLLDEPTDNLDVASAEALEAGLSSFEGTVMCVTHDRWFLRSFDRFICFGDDAEVTEVDEPSKAWR